MISKERLEALIKQGATIYSIFGGLQRVGLRLCENFIKDNKLYEIDERKVEKNEAQIFIGSLGDLFENEEVAEFALKFKRIPRTEYLDLPTWEEMISENSKYNYYGSSYFSFDDYRVIVKLPSEDDDCEVIGIDVNGNTELYHWEEAIKENYLLACELCRKLWLGEKV